MTSRTRPWLLAFACAALVVGSTPRAASAPGWLKDAVAAGDPSFGHSAAAIVLLDDVSVEFGADGQQHTVERYAVRVRAADGQQATHVQEVYQSGAGKIRDIKAWTIEADGRVIEYGRDRILDRALVNDDVHNDLRVQSVSAGADAQPGSVFGAEITSDEHGVATNLEWQLQSRWPVVDVRRSLKTPDQWSVKSVTFNHSPVAPAITGRVTQWEVRDLPEIPIEPAMPPMAELVPRLAVTVLPSSDARLPLFDSWPAVSKWLAEIQDPPASVTDAIRAKSTALIGAETSALGKIRALGRFVQDVRYVSVQMGEAGGGGYRPRPAADSLVKNYGDCKDKATLLRSLAAAAGFRAFMVGVYLGDPGFVRDEWPSPTQFNHAILAVSVDASVDAPAVIKDPQLGSLLIVDATDEQTPIGDLSLGLQGSLGLIVSASNGTLVRLPVLSPDRNLIERRWSTQIDAAGTLTGSFNEISHGDAAAEVRREVADAGAARFAELVQRGIAAAVRGARIDRFVPTSAPDQFDVSLSFTAPAYAQALQSTLLMVSPPSLGYSGPDLSSPARHAPIRLAPRSIKEIIDLQLPAALTVDEMPEKATIETTFGRFTATSRNAGGRVTLERSLVLPGSVVPADRVGEVRQFFDQIRAAATSPIVLKKSF